MVQGKLEARLWYKGNLKHSYGKVRETCSKVMVQGEARLVHGYGTRETWSTVMVQAKLEARLWYKGNLKHG